jgi:hypothetical protein
VMNSTLERVHTHTSTKAYRASSTEETLLLSILSSHTRASLI